MIIAESEIDYKVLRNYIEGYIDGIDVVLELNLMRKMTYWFQQKIGKKTSCFWTGYIPFHF
jgi:hypothetical protein